MKQSDTELIPDKFTLEVQRMDGGSWAVTSPEIQGMILAHNELSRVFLHLETVATRLIRHNGLPETRPSPKTEEVRKFKLGERVKKIKGSSWHGCIVGFYSTNITPIGYAVESEREGGCVQIYPEAALTAHTGEE